MPIPAYGTGKIMTFLDLATGWLALITVWLVQPILILLLGVFLGKVLEQVIVFIGAEVSPGGSRGFALSAYIASWLVYLTAVALALRVISLLNTVLVILGAMIAFVVLVHMILSGVDLLRNCWSGPSVRKKWKPGMSVQLKTVTGTVAAVGPALTRIATSTGDVLMVPNRTMKLLKPLKA